MDSKIIKTTVLLIDDIIEEILSRLPVKSLLRFRSVSKSWLSLISSERFIGTHFLKSTKNRAFSHHRVIFESELELTQCSLHPLLNEPSSTEPSPIYDPTNNQLMEGIVMGCCNGLICLHKHNSFILWNPATRISVELSKLDCHPEEVIKFGFGWDGMSGAYKVFVFLNNRWGIRKGSVYSSKTNSWKTIEQGCSSVRHGVFAYGKIHWLAESEDYYIESFDLESEEFGRIEPPCKPPKGCNRHYALAEIWGCLHLLCVHDDHHRQSYAIVWVMKESGWLKLFTHPLSFKPDYLTIRPVIGGGPNGEILLLFDDNYLVYYPKGKDVVRAGENRIKFYEGYVYVESLVSPNFTTAS